jgi:phosphorylcholine metabolism protein LicD
MKDVHEVLVISNIEYWVIAGTLLGAVRHKGLIPWDDDLDNGR